MVTYNVNQKKLRKKLIRIYSDYVSDDKAKHTAARENAAIADGAWTGAFLLDKDLESAVGGLVWLYLEPEMSTEKAKSVLADLKKAEEKKASKP